jgi:mRNA deadenylase 3'-5' endonuclease subunit Ccr4
MPFKVATYNVLATAYVRPDRYAGVPPELLRPDRRAPALVRHVEALDADLVCLQEVEGEVFSALSGRLGPLGYEGSFERKGGGRPDGCATFFRDGVFAPRDVRRLDYRDGSRHVALLLWLEHRGHLLGVANTHVRWDQPGTPRTRQVGYGQVVELLEEVGRARPACRGWLVCGDFNATPDSEAVAAMEGGGFGHAHADLPRARSCVANGRARLIDYLFHSGELRARPLEPPVLDDATRLPSGEEPSDHVALVAEFAWA